MPPGSSIVTAKSATRRTSIEGVIGTMISPSALALKTPPLTFCSMPRSSMTQIWYCSFVGSLGLRPTKRTKPCSSSSFHTTSPVTRPCSAGASGRSKGCHATRTVPGSSSSFRRFWPTVAGSIGSSSFAIFRVAVLRAVVASLSSCARRTSRAADSASLRPCSIPAASSVATRRARSSARAVASASSARLLCRTSSISTAKRCVSVSSARCDAAHRHATSAVEQARSTLAAISSGTQRDSLAAPPAPAVIGRGPSRPTTRSPVASRRARTSAGSGGAPAAARRRSSVTGPS